MYDQVSYSHHKLGDCVSLSSAAIQAQGKLVAIGDKDGLYYHYNFIFNYLIVIKFYSLDLQNIKTYFYLQYNYNLNIYILIIILKFKYAYQVSYSHKVGDGVSLSSAAIQAQGKLVAIGDTDGNVTLLELCEELWQPGPNEKNVIGTLFERDEARWHTRKLSA